MRIKVTGSTPAMVRADDVELLKPNLLITISRGRPFTLIENDTRRQLRLCLHTPVLEAGSCDSRQASDHAAHLQARLLFLVQPAGETAQGQTLHED